MQCTCYRPAFLRLSPTAAGALGRVCARPRLARRLGSSPDQLQEGEAGQEEVRERLERNILRAGLRALKGDRHSLVKNVQERAAAVDVQRLVCVCFI